MKIAVAADGQNLSEHIGTAQHYIVYTVEEGVIIKEEAFDNPGHVGSMNPPTFIKSLGVDYVLGGTVAQHAIDMMAEGGVEVILGVEGDAKEAAEAFIAGKIKHNEDFIRPCGGHA